MSRSNSKMSSKMNYKTILTMTFRITCTFCLLSCLPLFVGLDKTLTLSDLSTSQSKTKKAVDYKKDGNANEWNRTLIPVNMEGIQLGYDIYCGQKVDAIPMIELARLTDDVYASYSGPDNGLAYALDNKEAGEREEVAGARGWNMKLQKAYGICISLYEQHPVNGKMSGDPVADAFAILARGNSCIMLIADGVNWGEKSKLAARCALYGSMHYINHKIFTRGRQPNTTHDVFAILRASLNEAHQVILDREGGLTTLCACMVVPVKNSDQFAVCSLNVGDSYGYIFSHNHGIREVTQGSHDVSLVRDIRDAGGALGPVDGQKPELHNMTYGLSLANTGDIVFLTTDGISDNYDPVVTKIAVARLDSPLESKNGNDSESEKPSSSSPPTDFFMGKPEMEPKERHVYSMKEMERILHEHELVTEEQCSAQELCSALVQHVLILTDQKRKVLENPELYRRRRLSQKDKQRRDSEIVSKMSEAPGKLDHASIVAFEVGLMRQDEDAMDSIPLGSVNSDSDLSSRASSCIDNSNGKSPPKVTSPSTGSKKIRPKKLFNKLRNNLNIGSSPSSPTTENSPSFTVSPKRFSFKRSRTRNESDPLSPSSPTGNVGAPFPGFEGYQYPVSPVSPMPISPSSPERRLPISNHVAYRKPITFESSV